jgi:DNA-binding LacI/PurR family transcriptional regulator
VSQNSNLKTGEIMESEITDKVINSTSAESVPEQIARQIKKQIKNGKLPPGDMLPSLRELSEKLDIDINYVRDALELLQDEHLIKINPGIGSTVLAPNEWKHAALLLPDTAFGHYETIFKEISYHLKAAGWTLDLFMHHGKLELLQQHLKKIGNGDYAGVMAAMPVALVHQAEDIFSKLHFSGFPFVSIGGGLNCWTIDDRLYECGYWGTKHLIEQKYKRIAFVGCRSYDGEEFISGCKRALNEASLDDFGTGYAKDAEFALTILNNWLNLSKMPDAIFYQRSTHGAKCFQLMQAKNIQIGTEIGFITLDDTNFHRYTTPGPSTVRRYPERIGKKAVELFLELVNIPRKERLAKLDTPKRISGDIAVQPGRSSCGRKRRGMVHHAMNRIPTVQEQLLEYYPPEPPMPPGFWNGYNQR